MIRVLVLLGFFWPALSLAVIETYQFETEALQERYVALSAELRCPKCQNQNIADSNAPIAADLRAQLHQQLHAGKSDADIAEFMVQRYGEFVLYRPRWSSHTAALWLAPLLLLAVAVIALLSLLRGSKDSAKSNSVKEQSAQRQRLQQLLREESSND